LIDDLTYHDDFSDDEAEEPGTTPRGYPVPLTPFLADGTIIEVLGELKSGKEGTVYCCRANPSTGMKLLAAKVYRAREHRTFRNDAAYREGTVILNGHDRRAAQKKTDWGRKVKAGLWIYHEYEVLRMLSEAGADVPAPLAVSDHVMLMRYIGDEESAAPKLQEMSLSVDEARPLFDRVLANIELFLRLNSVHGDLSPYNILYWHGEITIIDFPQTVDARTNSHAFTLLQRDVAAVCRYFSRCGIRCDPERIARHLWGRYLRAEL
jgi:RIO kinase 1